MRIDCIFGNCQANTPAAPSVTIIKYLFLLGKNSSTDIPARPMPRLGAVETLKLTKFCAIFDAILLN